MKPMEPMATDPFQQLFDEIHQQPNCLRRVLASYPDAYASLTMPGQDVTKLIGIAEGSSYNALCMAAPLIEEFTGVNQFTYEPELMKNKFRISEWVSQSNRRLFERSYFIVVSQSGETGSILNILEHLQNVLDIDRNHLPVLALTNNPNSTLATSCTAQVDVQAGVEKSIAATKSMTGSLMALLLWGLYYGEQRQWLKTQGYITLLGALQQVPDQIERWLVQPEAHEQLKQWATLLSPTNQFVLLSKGPIQLILPEAGLKLTETSSNLVWVDNTESFKHGRKVILAGVKNTHPNCIYLVPPRLSTSEAQQFFKDVESHFFSDTAQVYATDRLFFVRFENSPVIPADLQAKTRLSGERIFTLPHTTGMASFFDALVFFQLMSFYLALERGVSPNNPSLTKAVTD